jgi:hypothetical protein
MLLAMAPSHKAHMLDFPIATLTLLAVMIPIPQGVFPLSVTLGLTVICILAIWIALRGERRRD